MITAEVTLTGSRRIRPVFNVGDQVDCSRCGRGAVIVGEPAFFSVAITNDAGYVQLHTRPAQPIRPGALGGSHCDTRHLTAVAS